jgi:hypothetical protein
MQDGRRPIHCFDIDTVRIARPARGKNRSVDGFGRRHLEPVLIALATALLIADGSGQRLERVWPVKHVDRRVPYPLRRRRIVRRGLRARVSQEQKEGHETRNDGPD